MVLGFPLDANRLATLESKEHLDLLMLAPRETWTYKQIHERYRSCTVEGTGYDTPSIRQAGELPRVLVIVPSKRQIEDEGTFRAFEYGTYSSRDVSKNDGITDFF